MVVSSLLSQPFSHPNSMRTLAIYTSVLEEEYKPVYAHLARELERFDIRTFVCVHPDRYMGNGRFSAGLLVRDGSWTRSDAMVEADIVFNKSLRQFVQDGTHIVNHPALDHACDKDQTVILFPQHCPRSVVVYGSDELRAAIEHMRSDMVVVKPTALFGGQGIQIAPRDQIQQSTAFPLIVQEFVDTAGGIDGICAGRHDLRLIYFGNTLVDAYVRQPANDGYISNVAQGGSIKQAPLDRIPADAIAFAQSIDAAFVHFTDRVYSIDIGRDRDMGWRLIELNSPPGFPLDEDETGTHIARLAEHLAHAEPADDPTVLTLTEGQTGS